MSSSMSWRRQLAGLSVCQERIIFMYEMVVRLVSGKANPLSRRWSDDGRRTHARSAPSTTFKGTLDYYSSIKYIISDGM